MQSGEPMASQEAALREVRRDLFSIDFEHEYSLCHCISEDLAMGKGIAVLFRDKFGRIDELKRQQRREGEVAFLSSGSCMIYYLITKPRYWNKPTYESLERCLVELRLDMQSRGMRKLGMPRIGSGLDGLEWSLVRAVIEKVFRGSNIDILVCIN